MKKNYILLPIVMLLFISACKKDEVIVEPEIPLVKEKRFPTDSISFTIAGKRYTNALTDQSRTRGASNRGTNLKLSAIEGDWAHRASPGFYWVGAADSVQYTSYSETRLDDNEGLVTIDFAKNYRRKNILHIGGLYYPGFEDQYYALGDQKYAKDFKREGKDEGVALEISLSNLGRLTSYSQKSLNEKSTLRAESYNNSTFNIIKITDIKDSHYVILEGVFQANLFDRNENAIKLNDGYFRLTVLKCGNRSSHLLIF